MTSNPLVFIVGAMSIAVAGGVAWFVSECIKDGDWTAVIVVLGLPALFVTVMLFDS